jgi:glycerol-3-phosphate dehydrogenase (NAD(P)+)
MPTRVAVVGVTAWGLTLAQLFAHADCTVTLLARSEDEAEIVRRRRTEPRRIAAVRLPASVTIASDPLESLSEAEIILMAVPSQTMRANLRRIADALSEHCLIVSAAKGLEAGTLLRMSQVITDECPHLAPPCALSGPNLAEEIARGLPATSVVAGPERAARMVQRALSSARFRVYTNTDIIGVELGGSLKNIIALAAGIGDGLGTGDNAKAALITRGLAEITRLGVALGANPLTFAGLSGLGDIIATCASPLSRNRRVGEELGRGRRLADILAELRHVAEGVTTTAAAKDLAERQGVEMPIVTGMDLILQGAITPAEGTRLLMERQPRGEFEG